MPLTPEEPTIHTSVPGSRAAAGTTRTPQASRSTAPLPGPRTSPRPAPPRGGSRPGPGHPGHGRTAPPGGRGKQPAASGPGIELVSATEATAVETADEVVDRLLDDGRAPGEVYLLTTGEPHPWAQHELSFGEDAYWRQLADGDDVFCADAASADRLTQRPVVVLAVNGGSDAQAAQALPAALAKASAQLLVCGDPQRIGALL